ncbi:hypothetical protein ONZ45_g12515 [Pleurotus djamor]|nr:hypothetical protein ONZ45_g12515 [Pleurotus djamor]
MLAEAKPLSSHPPSTVAAPSFSSFEFSTIGQAPSLLSRISDRRADDDVVSPSPTPNLSEDYIALPPDSEVEEGTSSVPLDRQSLLQALTSAQDFQTTMDVDGDHESIPKDSRSFPPTPQLRYPSPEPTPTVTEGPSQTQIKTMLKRDAAPSQAPPASMTTPAFAMTSEGDLPAPGRAEPDLRELEHILSTLSDLAGQASAITREPYPHLVAALELAETKNAEMLSSARSAQALAKQCLESANHALETAEETLRHAEDSHSRVSDLSKQIREMNEGVTEQNASANSLSDRISTLGTHFRSYIDARRPPEPTVNTDDLDSVSSLEPDHQNLPLNTPPVPTAPITSPSVATSKENNAGNESQTLTAYDIFRMHYAPEAEADIARRAWAAEQQSKSTLVVHPEAASSAQANVRATAQASETSESTAAPERRSSRTITLSERMRQEPVVAQAILGKRFVLNPDGPLSAHVAPISLPPTSAAPPPAVPADVLSPRMPSIGPERPVGNISARSVISAPRKPVSVKAAPSVNNVAPPPPSSSPVAPSSSSVVPAPIASSDTSVQDILDSIPLDPVPSLEFAEELPVPPLASPPPTQNREPSLPPIASLSTGTASSEPESSGPPSPQTPDISLMRESADTGNIPFVRAHSPVSLTVSLYNTKHLLEKNGHDWKDIVVEVERRELEETQDMLDSSVEPVSSLAKIRQESIAMAKQHALDQVSPSTRNRRTSLAREELLQDVDRKPKVEFQVPSASPPPRRELPVVPALNTSFQANGLPGVPFSVPPGPRQSPASTSQKRKYDDIGSGAKVKSPSTLPPRPANHNKRSRAESRPPPVRNHNKGDHWSPPPRTSFVDRVGPDFATPSHWNSYRPSQDDRGYESDKGRRRSPVFTPPAYYSQSRYDNRGSESPQDVHASDLPGLALRISSSTQPSQGSPNRGRGRARGGAAPRARRATGSFRGGRGRGGDLESRISDAPSTSLSDRLA